MSQKHRTPIRNEKGFASIEATVLIVLFVTLLYYSFGFFGAVHTGILHNIHARTYLFETFRHRANLMYFRTNVASNPLHYYQTMNRLHGINTDTVDGAGTQIATERPITMGMALEETGREAQVHSSQIFERIPASGRNTAVEVNPIWVLSMYGICLSTSCGGQ